MRPPVALMSVAVLLALAGCGSSKTAQDLPSGAPSVAVASVAAGSGLPPEPDEATQAQYIQALKAIDPAILAGKDESKLVNSGRDQCVSVKEWPKEEAKLVALTSKRFAGAGHPKGFGTAKNTKILAAVRKYICPTY